MRNQLITLIKKTYTTDDIGQKKSSETSREVFCQIGSVTQSEWFEAGRNGMKAEYRAVVDSLDYEGEEIAEINGTRYGIYRTYETEYGQTELYLEKKAGI